MNALENIIDVAGGYPSEPQEFVVPRASTSKIPKIVSTHVGALEQRLTFGLAAKLKLAAAEVMHAGKARPLMRAASVYGVVALLVFSLAAWVGINIFSTGAATMVLSSEAIHVTAPLAPETQEELVAAFEATFKPYEQDLISESTLAGRSALISQYLKEWNSPLVQFSDTIAAQAHWKRILAISFAESGLGKKCADNNCSGIGVEPGHPKWQTYETKGEWAKAMNRLLEKRYSDWTLKQMNGVYNYPGSENWLMATTQIMNDLEARQIQ